MMCWKGFGRKKLWLNLGLPWNLPRETEENHKNPQVSRCLIPYSNQAPPEYKSRALRLDQPVQFRDEDKLTELVNNTNEALNVINCINIPLIEIGLK
jgi:hypothetical protein